ncbi:hypothetical protein J6590_088113 [Homalodisca vitripennis]|nr:hypothetical protein J6590_088113 [Homalodisca vitripennis]
MPTKAFATFRGRGRHFTHIAMEYSTSHFQKSCHDLNTTKRTKNESYLSGGGKSVHCVFCTTYVLRLSDMYTRYYYSSLTAKPVDSNFYLSGSGNYRVQQWCGADVAAGGVKLPPHPLLYHQY